MDTGQTASGTQPGSVQFLRSVDTDQISMRQRVPAVRASMEAAAIWKC